MSDAREQAIEIVRGVMPFGTVSKIVTIANAFLAAGWRPPEPAEPEWFAVMLQEPDGEWNLSWDGELFAERADAEASLAKALEDEWPVKLARVVPVSAPEAGETP